MTELHAPIGTLVKTTQRIPIGRFDSAGYTSDAREGEMFIYIGPAPAPGYFVGYTFIGVNLDGGIIRSSGVRDLVTISSHINQDRVKGLKPTAVRNYLHMLNAKYCNGYYSASAWVIRCDATDLPLTNKMKKHLLEKGE